MRRAIVLIANTSWYLYNFRRGTLRALVSQGNEVSALSPPDDFSQRLLSELKVQHVALPMDGKSTGMVRELATFLALYRFLSCTRPAFVYNYTVKPNIYGGLICRWLRIPYANNISGLGTAFIHDSWLFRRVRSLYGLANRGATHVFFQNQEDRDLFLERELLSNTPHSVLPGSGINTVHFQPAPWPDAGPFTFVLIARLLGDKGVREYASAAGRLRSEFGNKVRCLLIGPLGASNRSAIAEHEVGEWQSSGAIVYIGEQADIRPWLQASHVLVLPSYREGMPRTVLEAAAMARPALVTDVPGCRQAVVAGKTGWLVPARDADALFAQMRHCMTLPASVLQAMGRAARERVEQHFDEAIVIDATLSCLPDSLRQQLVTDKEGPYDTKT